MNAEKPNKQLWKQIRAGFLSNCLIELSFRQWCLSEGVRYQNARKAFTGTWNGPRALKFRERAIEFAQQA